MRGIKCYALRLYIENGCQTPDYQKRKSTRKRRHRVWNSGNHRSGSDPYLIYLSIGRVPAFVGPTFTASNCVGPDQIARASSLEEINSFL